jgi:arylsulfatase A-like enzyme
VRARDPSRQRPVAVALLGLAAALPLLAGCGRTVAPAAVDRPNVVLVIGDDLGWQDYGFMGSEVVQTPTLDRLAAEGTVFETGYVPASVCRPTMRTLLSGLHPLQWKHRVEELAARGTAIEPQTEVRAIETQPRLLAAAGYATFQAGKLWEGETFRDAGFTHGTKRRAPAGFALDRASLRLMRVTMEPLRRFLDQAPRPFYIWLAPLLPHQPHDPPERLLARYDPGLAPAARAYYANVTRFDEGVGELVAMLRERDLLASTLIVYLADNGWSVDPERGKHTLHESGLRTPVLFSWPGHVKAQRLAPGLVDAADVVATIFDYAGVEPPAESLGRSLRPVLEGRSEAVRDAVFGRRDFLRDPESTGDVLAVVPGGRFARTARWHYIWWIDGREELYDVLADPAERNDVSPEHADVCRELQQRIAAWEGKLLASPAGGETAPQPGGGEAGS